MESEISHYPVRVGLLINFGGERLEGTIERDLRP
jgi:hypothetical protein